MTRIKYGIIRRIREFDVAQFKRIFKEELSTHLATFKRDKILIRVEDTIESIILTTLTANTIDRKLITLVYFPSGYKSRIPRILKRMSTYLDIPIITIDTTMIISSLENFVRGLIRIKKMDIHEDIIGFIIRRYADEKGYFILGEYSRTSWMLGGFNDNYIKSIDYLPLSKVYYSQLRHIARELKALPLIREAKDNQVISNLIGKFKIADNELIDGILYGIEYGYTNEEISKDLDIDVEAIEEIRRIINDNYLKRNRPLTIF